MQVAKTSAKILFITALFLLIYAWRLNFPSLMYFDEVYFVPAAQGIANLSGSDWVK